MEHDSTALDPEEPTADQTPPKEFEPQVELGPGQEGGVVERESDLVEDAEAEGPDDLPESDGQAQDGDDEAEEDDD